MSITSTLRSLVWIAFFLILAAFPLNSFAQYAGWAVGDAKDGYGTILRTTDSGSTWTRQGAGQIADVKMSGVVAVDPFTAWMVGASDGYATIYHTTNGGSTWARKGSAADVPPVDLAKVHAFGDNKVWAVGEGTILHTSDGGTTWTNQIPAGYESIVLQGVYTPDGINVWVTGDHNKADPDDYATILKSTNAGPRPGRGRVGLPRPSGVTSSVFQRLTRTPPGRWGPIRRKMAWCCTPRTGARAGRTSTPWRSRTSTRCAP